MEKTGKLTIQEAANWVMRPDHTKRYRRECIAWWRNAYGDEYADLVVKLVESQFKEKRRGKSKV